MTPQRSATTSIAAALALALGACGGAGPDREAADLALACQTRDCVCARAADSAFSARRETAVLWRANGDGYCPDGFALETAGG